MISYADVITTQGIKIPFVPDIITPNIERPMRNNRYESGETALLKKLLTKGDRVLELGAGVGLVSTIAALTPGVEAVLSIEANPDLIPLIRETHRLNGAERVEVRNGVATAEEAPAIKFYLRRDFWASSMEAESRPYVREEVVPAQNVVQLVRQFRPTVIVCDIEGGELGLFDNVDFSGVRCIAIEFHNKVYGEEGREAIIDIFTAAGFHRGILRDGGSVELFHRQPSALASLGAGAEQKPSPAPVADDARDLVLPQRLRDANKAPWPPADPRVFVATCMKNEGPFILEWVAWLRAIGVTDIMVFSNHCDDGSDEILTRLDQLGYLTHLPNPALATGATAYQPIALAYASLTKEMKAADFFISTDVDEFINIRVGEGKLRDLFAAVDRFDVLSMSELNHGSNGELHYRPGWVKDIFVGHQSERPGQRLAHRGVKSIVRLSPAIKRIRNHRPDIQGDTVTWLDGSGRARAELIEDRSANGLDCRNSYGLVSLDHYPLRSLDSYMVKMFRGDVVVDGKRVSQRYWRVRDKAEVSTSLPSRADLEARAIYQTMLADPQLAGLHDQSCRTHATRVTEILKLPDFADMRAKILASMQGED